MNTPPVRHPVFNEHGHPSVAVHGDPDVPMDLLALAEVAELLGEPESVILAACQSFPEHVPVLGSGRARRFPSIALDVLRVITDATAAGVSAAAITHLLETRYTAAQTLVDEIQTAPGGIPTGYELDPEFPDADEFVERLRRVVADDILPLVQSVVSELGIARADLEHMRTNAPEIKSELAKLQTQLRPALYGFDEMKLAMEGLREEMAALRWQLDHREQLAQLIAEMADLRTQVGRLEAGARERVGVGQPNDRPLEQESLAAETLEVDRSLEPSNDSDEDDLGPEATAPPPPDGNQPDGEVPSAIITEFASRTPRRMGRALFADEG